VKSCSPFPKKPSPSGSDEPEFPGWLWKQENREKQTRSGTAGSSKAIFAGTGQIFQNIGRIWQPLTTEFLWND